MRDDIDDTEEILNRIIRVETRVARLQAHFGLPTRMDVEDLDYFDPAPQQPIGRRLTRIETRVFRLMQHLGMNPHTGKRAHDEPA